MEAVQVVDRAGQMDPVAPVQPQVLARAGYTLLVTGLIILILEAQPQKA